jgi:hypothetical protein
MFTTAGSFGWKFIESYTERSCSEFEKEMNREDILSFLDSLRKPEVSDPQHKWVGTYLNCQVLLVVILSCRSLIKKTKTFSDRKYSSAEKKRTINL